MRQARSLHACIVTPTMAIPHPSIGCLYRIGSCLAHHGPIPSPDTSDFTRSFLGVFRFSGRALELVWSTSRPLTLWLGLLTLVGGLLPAGIAYVGALIIDAVVAASRAATTGGTVEMAGIESNGV